MIKMSRKEKKELAASELLLIVAAVIGLVAVFWLGWVRPSNKPRPTVDSFESCVQAGYPVQQSYPEVCVTPDGGHYKNSDQLTTTTPIARYLDIKEWDTRVSLNSTTQDAYYKYNADKTIFVSTRNLDAAVEKVEGCRSGLHGLTFGRAMPGDQRDEGGTWTKDDLAAESKPVNNYYIYEKPMVETLCVATDHEQEQATVKDIQSAIRTTFKSPLAE